MLFKPCILAVLAASLVSARRMCGTPNATPQELQAIEDSYRDGTDLDTRDMLVDGTSIDINVYFHIVAASNSIDDGYIPNEQISGQLDALNDAYNPHQIAFKFAGGERVAMPRWADNCQEIEMKEKLQNGTFADLNVYFFPSIECIDRQATSHDETLGYTTNLPGVKTITSLSRSLDAVHIRADTLPGESKPFNEGKTLVHEVGHWLGLLHTFSGGCFGGDRISDTPAEDDDTAVDESGTCKRRDSCSGGGDDPIENYMDYSSDECLTKFTPKQAIRMHNTWVKYREPYKKN